MVHLLRPNDLCKHELLIIRHLYFDIVGVRSSSYQQTPIHLPNPCRPFETFLRNPFPMLCAYHAILMQQPSVPIRLPMHREKPRVPVIQVPQNEGKERVVIYEICPEQQLGSGHR